MVHVRNGPRDTKVAGSLAKPPIRQFERAFLLIDTRIRGSAGRPAVALVGATPFPRKTTEPAASRTGCFSIMVARQEDASLEAISRGFFLSATSVSPLFIIFP